VTYGQATRKPIDSQEGTLGAGRRDAMLLSLVLAPMRKQRWCTGPRPVACAACDGRRSGGRL